MQHARSSLDKELLIDLHTRRTACDAWLKDAALSTGRSSQAALGIVHLFSQPGYVAAGTHLVIQETRQHALAILGGMTARISPCSHNVED